MYKRNGVRGIGGRNEESLCVKLNEERQVKGKNACFIRLTQHKDERNQEQLGESVCAVGFGRHQLFPKAVLTG